MLVRPRASNLGTRLGVQQGVSRWNICGISAIYIVAGAPRALNLGTPSRQTPRAKPWYRLASNGLQSRGFQRPRASNLGIRDRDPARQTLVRGRSFQRYRRLWMTPRAKPRHLPGLPRASNLGTSRIGSEPVSVAFWPESARSRVVPMRPRAPNLGSGALVGSALKSDGRPRALNLGIGEHTIRDQMAG